MTEPGERGVVVAAVLNLETGTSEEELLLFTGWTHDEVRAFGTRLGEPAGEPRLSESEQDLVLAAFVFALWVTSDAEADMFIGRSHDEIAPLVAPAPPRLLVGLFQLYAVRRGTYLHAQDPRPATYLATRLADVANALGEHRDLLRPLLDSPHPDVRREASAAFGFHQADPGL